MVLPFCSHLLLIQWTQFLCGSTYKIYVFAEAFFFFATAAKITQNVTFFSFCNNHCKGAEPFHEDHPEIKATKKNCCKDVSSILTHCSKSFFLGFYNHLSHTWVDLICWTNFICLILTTSLDSFCSEPPYRNFITSYFQETPHCG